MNKNLFEEYRNTCFNLKSQHTCFSEHLKETFPKILSIENYEIKNNISKDFEYIWKSITDLKSKVFKKEDVIFSPPYIGIRYLYRSYPIEIRKLKIINDEVAVPEQWRSGGTACFIKDFYNMSGINKENFNIFYSLLKEAVELFGVNEEDSLAIESDDTSSYNKKYINISVYNHTIRIQWEDYKSIEIMDIGESFKTDVYHLDSILKNFDEIEKFLNEQEEKAIQYNNKLKEFAQRVNVVANQQRMFENLKS